MNTAKSSVQPQNLRIKERQDFQSDLLEVKNVFDSGPTI